MADLMYVQDAERPDLRSFAKLTQDDLKGYAFAKFLPVITVSEKGGKIWVAPKNLTNQKGQVNRANGSSITTDTLQTIEVSYSCDRIEGRGQIFESEMHGYSDENAAAQAGASDAGRRALNAIEDEAVKTVFTPVRTTAKTVLADHQVLKLLQGAAKSVRAYGKAALVMSDEAFLKFCEIPEIRRRLEMSMKATGDIAYLALNDEKVLQTISTLLGFRAIAIFDSDIVGSAYDNYVGVVAIRPEAFGVSPDMVRSIAKSRALFGAAFVWVPAGAPSDEPFVVSQSADKTDKCNYWDAEGWLDPKNFVDAKAASGDTSKLAENGGAVVCQFAEAYTEYAVPVVNVTGQA